MKELNLEKNEEVIYTSNMYFTNAEINQKEYSVYLTNLNLILYKQTKRLFREPKIELLKFPLTNFSLVDNEPFFEVFKNDEICHCGIRVIYQRKIIELTFEDDGEEDYTIKSKTLGNLLTKEINKIIKTPKICPLCNTLIADDMLFCQSCGTKI